MRIITATLLSLVASAACAQQPGPQPNAGMSFFITSASPGKGADLGGLDGADKHCQTLAAAVGQGSKTWRAYLSTQAADGKPAINAKDRVGKGPFLNFRGETIAKDIADLHNPETNKISTDSALTEKGQKVMGRGWLINYHDVLTGTQTDGTAFGPEKDMTCGNWTKSGAGSAMVGHHDRQGLDESAPAKSWNTAHPSRGSEGGCSQADLRSTGGGGLLYCFAAN